MSASAGWAECLQTFEPYAPDLQRLEELESMEQDGTLESESKKHASRLKREMRKIRGNMDGVRKMARLPGAVVVVDARKEYLALREAKKLGIETVGLLDTDSDPDTVDVAIPANDDSIRAIELILNELADAVAIGKTMTLPVLSLRAGRSGFVRRGQPLPALANLKTGMSPPSSKQHRKMETRPAGR